MAGTAAATSVSCNDQVIVWYTSYTIVEWHKSVRCIASYLRVPSETSIGVMWQTWTGDRIGGQAMASS
jgi:hypothetical protein